MAKVAKKTQTDYTRGGHDISQMAIPMYQENLKRTENYLSNPTGAIDEYLNKYYSNTPEESDFLRNYNRAMAARTGQNYASTGGGFSSANQQGYDDLQRYMNDYAARLRLAGVSNAAQLAQNYYNNLLSGQGAYQSAYQLGQPYSDVEQWNYMAGQVNSPWTQMGSTLGAVGTGVGATFGGPVGAVVGNAIGSGLGSTMQTQMPGMGTVDTSAGLGQLGLANLAGATNSLGISNALENLFGNKNRQQTSNQATLWSSGTNLDGIGNYGLNTTRPTSGYKFSWQKQEP